MDKIIIEGTLEVLTGLHIGNSDGFSGIGAVDSVTIKDPVSSLPIIPGSSLKGKLRYLLARRLNHEISTNVKDDVIEIKRLFGSSSDGELVHKSRLLFSDLFITNLQELEKANQHRAVEVKAENVINRINAVATPRFIERVIRGTKFNLSVVYDVEKITEIQEDLKNLLLAFRELEYDYLGGNGSRGYGRVKCVIQSIDTLHGNEEVDRAIEPIKSELGL